MKTKTKQKSIKGLLIYLLVGIMAMFFFYELFAMYLFQRFCPKDLSLLARVLAFFPILTIKDD